MTVWLDNPGQKRRRVGAKAKARRRGKRRPPQGYATWAVYMASIRPTRAKKRRRRTSTRSNPMARKTRRRHTVRRAGRRTRRRSRRGFRRNPPVARGLVQKLVKGAQGAAVAVFGKAGANILGNLVPLPGGPVVRSVAGAAGVALVADMAVPARFRDAALIGALMAPIEELIRGLNLPILSPALSAYPPLASYPLGAIPVPPVAALGAGIMEGASILPHTDIAGVGDGMGLN